MGRLLFQARVIKKFSAINDVGTVCKHVPKDELYEKKIATNGKFYFNLKAANHQIIGSSQMYASGSGRNNGIKPIKTNAPDALRVDEVA